MTAAVTRAAVLGSPITHSLSPVLHAAAYQALGLSGWSYEAIECDQEGLGELLGSCGPDWAGVSLTMPLKRAALPLVDAAEPLVAEVGAANTVIFADGARRGYNTDVPGIITTLAEAGAAALTGPVLILGGGATACSALAALRSLGADGATVAVRDPATTGGLLAAADRLGMGVRLTAFDQPQHVRDTQLLISTAPARAADSYCDRIGSRALAPSAVLDVVYHPWPTRLATAARQAGAIVAAGFDLLVHQAARQVELMTGQEAPVPVMRRAGLDELRRRATLASRRS